MIGGTGKGDCMGNKRGNLWVSEHFWRSVRDRFDKRKIKIILRIEKPPFLFDNKLISVDLFSELIISIHEKHNSRRETF